MPRSVHLMALGIFAMVTSELLVGGLMPQMAEDLDTTIPRIGYLITAFALAMALGGPILTLAVLRLRTHHALLALFAVFFAGNTLAALSAGYWPMVLARVITGAAAGAFFGVALSAVAQVTPAHLRGRATGLALQGLMVGTLLGLPLSSLIGGQFGWRAAFVFVGILTVVIAVATLAALPRVGRPDDAADPLTEFEVFRRPQLWFVMGTSTLVIGATFAAFSYFTPVLTEVTGFSRDVVPLLLLVYGGATVLGSWLGGMGIEGFGLRAPLWIGAGLALLALLTMVPPALRALRVGHEAADTAQERSSGGEGPENILVP